jgi:hypothetical protein
VPIERRRWRKDSIFGDGPRVILDRERRAQAKAMMKLQRRPGRLTIAAAQIGCILVDMLGPDGQLYPSHHRLAELACVHVATVKRALEQLRQFGFLDWTRRLVRCGPRCEQTSNAYVLRLPSCEAHFARAVSLFGFKKGRQTEQPALPGLQPVTRAVEAAREALARRRAVIEARLRGQIA